MSLRASAGLPWACSGRHVLHRPQNHVFAGQRLCLVARFGRRRCRLLAGGIAAATSVPSFASPKSRSLTPCCGHEDVAGFRSRCVMPLRCAAVEGREDLSRRTGARARAAAARRAAGRRPTRARGDTARVFKTVDAGNVRMIQCGDGFRFALETGKTLRVCREEFGEDLDRHVALESRVARPVDLAHPAGPKSGKDFVRAEAGAGGEGQLLSWIIRAERQRRRRTYE